MYVVVQFEDSTVESVPLSWFTDHTRQAIYWPKYRSTSAITAVVKKREKPNPAGWTVHPVTCFPNSETCKLFTFMSIFNLITF